MAFKAQFLLHFRCQNILHTVLIKGYTGIDEKVPCSRIINKYLIKGMVKPEAQILSFILISILLLQHLLWTSSADWCLKGEGTNCSAGGWHWSWRKLVRNTSLFFQSLSPSCHQLWVLKRSCHFIQRDLLGQKENLNTKHAAKKPVKRIMSIQEHMCIRTLIHP